MNGTLGGPRAYGTQRRITAAGETPMSTAILVHFGFFLGLSAAVVVLV